VSGMHETSVAGPRVGPVRGGLGGLRGGKAGPPHQRAIAENPEVLGGVIDAHHPSITTKSPICRSYGQNGAAGEFYLGKAVFGGFDMGGGVANSERVQEHD